MKLGDYLIRETLRNEPEKAVISDNGNALHVLNPDGTTRTFTGAKFSEMTQDEIIQFVVSQMR